MGRPSPDTTNTTYHKRLQSWLEKWKFRANPFEHNRAEREPDLESYFIPTPAYTEASRGVSSLIFIEQGGGKTAHLLMLARNARPHDPQSDVLAVQYVEFGALLPELETSPVRVSTNQHIAQILRLASDNLLQSLLMNTERLSVLPGEWLATFAWFCETYRPAQAAPREVITWMRETAQPGAKLEWTKFRQAVDERQVRAYLSKLKIEEPSCGFLARLLDTIPEPPYAKELSPSEILRIFTSLLPQAGLARMHVLVGGLEDVIRFNLNQAELAEFIYPLLSDVHIMKLPDANFSLLLPGASYDYLKRGKTGRLLDRLVHRQVTWDLKTMRNMFAERLVAYRSIEDTGQEMGLAALCAPNLRPIIERDIFDLAKGSPRQALMLCNALLRAHCSRETTREAFTAEDWWLMIEEIYDLPARRDGRTWSHPPLRIKQAEHQVLVGNDVKQLPDALYNFLLVFYKYPDRWLSWHDFNEISRLSLTADNFRKHISRVRRAIEPNPKKPVYLVTKRGLGVRLENAWPEVD